VSYVVRLAASGEFGNNMRVSSDQPDLNTSNNSVNVKIEVPDFTLSPAAASLNVKRGAQASETLTFAAQGGFSGSIVLTCSVSGPLPGLACGVSPNSVTPGGSATLTVNAAGISAALAPQSLNMTTGLRAALPPIGIFGFVLALSDRKRRRLWMLCLLLIVATILPVACGGGSSNWPPRPLAQSYIVTVTATSGTLQHSTAIAVSVN